MDAIKPGSINYDVVTPGKTEEVGEEYLSVYLITGMQPVFLVGGWVGGHSSRVAESRLVCVGL